MKNMTFYPMLTTDMIFACGASVSDYKFIYDFNGQEFELTQSKKGDSSIITLTDPNGGIWNNVEEEGLRIIKEVRIAYPDLLKGKQGVICKDAEFDLCIIWTNEELTQTGIIKPLSVDNTQTGRVYKFDYTFERKCISGDLELSLTAYISKKADTVQPDELDLINEVGITVGEIEEPVILDLKKIYMDFPIVECRSDNDPLWWVWIGDLPDPKCSDRFSKESFCLYLNTHFKECPLPLITSSGSGFKNPDLMIDILAQTYLLIISKLSDEDKRATSRNIGLTPGSVCSVLHQFVEQYPDELSDLTVPPEVLLKNLQKCIRDSVLKGGQ